MTRAKTIAGAVLMIALAGGPVWAQIPGFGGVRDKVNTVKSKVDPYAQKAKQLNDINKPWSKDDEEQIGTESAAKLIEVFGLYDNKAMQNYVSLVGTTVAMQGARQDIEYHFAILDTDTLNAMALPGGFVFVTRGALANMKNEAELAGTLAHEVAHVDGRHLENELKTKGNLNFLVQQGQQEGSRRLSGDELTQLAVQKVGQAAANAVLTTPFSEGDEAAADKKGLEFSAKAGYNAAGLRDFLKTLAAAQDDPKFQQATGAWSQTHPPFPTRIANLEKVMGNYPANGQTLEDRFKKNVSEEKFAAVKSAGE